MQVAYTKLTIYVRMCLPIIVLSGVIFSAGKATDNLTQLYYIQGEEFLT
jgi:hypothetical protein